MRRAFAALAAMVVLWTFAPVAALAAETPTVTLAASAGPVEFGQAVTLSGAVSPAADGETVEIRDDTDALAVTLSTDPTGAFSTSFVPDHTVTLHAVWNTVASPPVTVRVRAVVTVRMSPVRLFGTTTVRGNVAPTVPGARVEVSLVHSGRTVATKTPRIGSGGGYAASFRLMEPGRYRARATFVDDTHLRGAAATASSTTPLPTLRQGSRSDYVRLLEQRLLELHYRLVGINRAYDDRTADAVLAFRKVQGMDRVFTVNPSVWRALADPRVPKPRLDVRGLHIEIDQTHQVLYTVQRAEITNIIHISSGKPSTPTRDGSFHVSRKIAGFSSHHLYYPSYFDGNRAIHGWTEVPTYPASHGCVRVPYWHAQWIYGLATIGTRVIVYHA
jgi:N-acetylmuramoyl-L-alanine amidase